MGRTPTSVHPYIPNSVPDVKAQMLQEIGVQSTEDFYGDIPEELRMQAAMQLPPPLRSEQDLKRHVASILVQNKTCVEYLNFLGAGCYQHYVPAVCDEINQRGEFLTAYAGEPYEDHGRWQALFEYASMMGELLEMDVVNIPTYDGFQASATALRMAARITGRREALLCGAVDPARLSKIADYCQPDLEIRLIGYDLQTGQMDRRALKAAVSPATAAVYFDNPSYLGFIECHGGEIAAIAHDSGAVCVVGADPISLGVLTPPAMYGADIVCGDIQPLGMHMQFGGGQAGFIATRDEVEYVLEYPSRLFGLAPTVVPGEYGFGDVAYERTSFAIREEGKEWVGTAAALWGITAGVYLALMGPQGMVEIGEGLMQRCRYLMKKLALIPGLRLPFDETPHFAEFVVNFDATGRTAAQINQALLEREIFGGKDLSTEFPALGQSLLFCVSEVHTQADLDRLADVLKEVVR